MAYVPVPKDLSLIHIFISCGARLAPFDIKELRELMETDEMELDTIGDRKTALFVIISDTDDTFNFVVSILYTQPVSYTHLDVYKRQLSG